MEPYEKLANAIIEFAVDEYKKALKYNYKNPNNISYESDIAELERFFRSEWFMVLTDLDGGRLMKGVREMVLKEVAA